MHHGNKAGTGERGSSALRGGADFMLELSKTNDRLTLSCSKQKDDAPFTALSLHLTPAMGAVTVQEGTLNYATCVVGMTGDLGTKPQPGDRMTPQERQAFDTLRDLFGADGATIGEWLRAGHIPERTLYHVAAALRTKGHIRKSKNRYFVEATA